MYNSSVEQSLVDDARAAYEYGLSSVPISTEFSFVDQRMPVQAARPPAHSAFRVVSCKDMSSYSQVQLDFLHRD